MPKLDGPRRRVAKLMVDTCTITRNLNRYAAGLMSPTKLEVDETVPTTVYDGKCFVVPSGLQAQTKDVAGSEASQKGYLCSIPWDSPKLRPGDIVTLKTSQDSLLLGREFEIKDVMGSTVLVWRQASMTGLETSRG